MTGKKKKSNLFSAIKRIFSSKNGADNKKGKGLWGDDEKRSFFPLFRPPSSIEKILGEADELNIRPPFLLESPKTLQNLVSKKSTSPPKVMSMITNSDRYPEPSPPEAFTTSSSNGGVPFSDPVTEDKEKNSSVKKRTCSSSDPNQHSSLEAFSPNLFNIEDPSFDASSSLTEGSEEISCLKKRVSPTECVKKTLSTSSDKHSSALKIQKAYRRHLARKSSRTSKGIERLQRMMKGQSIRRQTMNAIKQMQLLVRVQTHIQSQRMQALQNQSYRSDKDVESTSSKRTLNQILSESVRNEDWDDSLLTKEEVDAQLEKKVEAVMKRERAMSYAYSHKLWNSNTKLVGIHHDAGFHRDPWLWNWFSRQLPLADSTPSRASCESKTNAVLHRRCYKHNSFDSKSRGSETPGSTKSAAPFTARARNRNSRMGTKSLSLAYDDDSLVSCPPFTRPNYMTPTISAMSKFRDTKKRFALPFTPNSGNFKWNKRDSDSPTSSAANSIVSMPALLGRKPFNRFV